MTAKIPLVDLGAQHRQIADEVNRGFASVFNDTSFILGAPVAEFEKAYAQFVGVKHCVCVANGTDALELAIRAALRSARVASRSPSTARRSESAGYSDQSLCTCAHNCSGGLPEPPTLLLNSLAVEAGRFLQLRLRRVSQHESIMRPKPAEQRPQAQPSPTPKP